LLISTISTAKLSLLYHVFIIQQQESKEMGGYNTCRPVVVVILGVVVISVTTTTTTNTTRHQNRDHRIQMHRTLSCSVIIFNTLESHNSLKKKQNNYI